jgi:hypothetical protein
LSERGRRREGYPLLNISTQPGGTVTMTMKDLSKRNPRKGDVVRIRSVDEILSTLDHDNTVNNLLFMPEMLKYAGREFRVEASAHKTCDGAGGIREMDNTVHLEGVKCDGSAHGGCQAGCKLFWREEWLTPASEPQSAASATTDETALAMLRPQTRRTNDSGESVYRCQGTDVGRASRPLSKYDPRQYVRDLTSGNITLRALLAGLVAVAFNRYQLMTQRVLPHRLRIRGGKLYPFYQGTGTGARTPIVDVAPGELVEIRKKDEIMPTLSPENNNRRLWFDPEAVPFCSTRARVNRHVQRIIDESTGKMIKLGDCVALDDVKCPGQFHRFCQRGIDIYWRSAWLRPLNGEDGDQPSM